ncbi:hypothetical protein PF002_g7320 [Phytophthora fragariae]|uniref:Uncharacterized protein n=1 Tax=Phytophthora fragariae TaxID=53985 RepID=A0A6A3ZY55_9STRA|nr:hypothetical protein PF002_g7320 [Phytophthora fragariae]
MPAFALPASPSSSPVAASSPPPTQQPAVAPPATSPATASIPPAATPTQPAPTVGSGEDAARPPLAGGLTHRASKRLQKRKADVAARSAERKSKLARSAPPPSGFSLEALLAAPPVLAAAPAVRTKAAGKQKAGSASRAARKPTQPTGPATSDAATGGGSGGAPTLVSGAKAPDRHRRVATASPSPARHTVIYLDSPMPPVSGASGVTLARTAFPPMPNASRDGDTEENFDLASFLESTSAPPPGGATRPSDAGYLHTQPAQTTADEAAARLIAQSLPAPRAEPTTQGHPASAGPNRRMNTNHATGIPEHIRQLVPRRPDGKEPCLRFFGGEMCFGGSRERCANSYRTHSWEGHLPRELQSYINKQYGSNRRGQHGPREGARRT